MKTLYLECGMGAAGDMLTAALLSLFSEERQKEILETLNGLGLHGVEISAADTVRSGICGLQMQVRIHGEEEESRDAHEHGHRHAEENYHCHAEMHEHMHEHAHEHSHEEESHHHHHHHHHHTSLAEIEAMVGVMPLPEKVRTDVLKVYRLIAEAEGHAHGRPVEEIHFHEVGSLDAVMDVTAVSYLLYLLAPDEILASPVNVGSGHVHCAHGIMPVPAPATAYLLRDIPSFAAHAEAELCTPTGAALLRYFVKDFGKQPMMRVQKTGYGMGKKEFAAANCVRAFFGERADASAENAVDGRLRDRVLALRCNLDDMTGEELGFAQECLLEAGALDVFTESIMMKKNRPAVLLTVLCHEGQKAALLQLLFKHTTTLGVRVSEMERYILNRREESVALPEGTIRVKTAEGYGATRRKAEYEDLRRLALEKDISLREARRLLAQYETAD